VQDFYKPLAERTPDTQYIDSLKFILKNGRMIRETPQGVGALTCFGTLPKMIFDLSNGIPVITDRKMGFWRKPIAEITAFINGARTIDEIESFGCNFWEEYRGKGTLIGLDPDDMGPGSYGPVFHDFELFNGETLNQYAEQLEQIRLYSFSRTLRITNWHPKHTLRGPNRKVIVAPCHGDQHFRVIDDELHLHMVQRSGDMPVGIPSNMIQYAAVLLMMCQVTGYKPGTFVHTVSDAHIYENQIEKVQKLIERSEKSELKYAFPILRVDPSITNLFDFRVEHFELEEYSSYPHMNIPYSP
jgi:thymidylate synthase